MIRRVMCLAVVCLYVPIIFGGCARDEHSDHEHHDDSHGESEEGHGHAVHRGVHGGRMLEEGPFGLEIAIFEDGVPPQFRIYGYHEKEALSPEDFHVALELHRLGRATQFFDFKPFGVFYSSSQVVSEPHSFDVLVRAKFQGREYTWKFSTYEGRTTLSDEVASLSGVQVERVQERALQSTTRIFGRVGPSEHRIAHIVPRFAGVVKEGRKHIGDSVKKGEVLAIIESNESLQPFEVRSQISGTVINGHVIVGEFVPENQWIYVVADLSEVWADLFVPLDQEISLRLDQRIQLQDTHGHYAGSGIVSYVAPYADERSQSQLIRVIVPNPDGKLLPGAFISGDLVLDERAASLSVRKEAIQRFRDWNVVFRKVGSFYEATPVELGIQDDTWVEITSGLLPGDEYVTKNSFLLKADVLKSGASHDH